MRASAGTSAGRGRGCCLSAQPLEQPSAMAASAKKAIAGLEAGQVLRIIATDPGSVKDFEAFAKQTGNELMESGEEDGKFVFMMKKA